MHHQILNKQQKKILPLLKKFSSNFGLVGGTAIALYLEHRQSIDFDLFTLKKFKNLSIRNIISKYYKIEKILINELDEYTIIVNGVKITFLHFPFKIEFNNNFDNIIKTPDLLTLGAMKIYALGQRAKWKDYVDLYFIIKNHYSLKQIIKKAKQIFKNEFNEKIIRVQLAYFKDIDYSEKIIYTKGFEINNKIIEKKLRKISLN